MIVVLGAVGSIASIVGLFLAFNSDSVSSSNYQVQSGSNNIQAGRDVIVNQNGVSTRDDDGVFLYEEKIELYCNEWWAHSLQSKESIKKYGQAEVTILSGR